MPNLLNPVCFVIAASYLIFGSTQLVAKDLKPFSAGLDWVPAPNSMTAHEVVSVVEEGSSGFSFTYQFNVGEGGNPTGWAGIKAEGASITAEFGALAFRVKSDQVGRLQVLIRDINRTRFLSNVLLETPNTWYDCLISLSVPDFQIHMAGDKEGADYIEFPLDELIIRFFPVEESDYSGSFILLDVPAEP
jgi:hypothetical protein